jgi:hypothetical protein
LEEGEVVMAGILSDGIGSDKLAATNGLVGFGDNGGDLEVGKFQKSAEDDEGIFRRPEENYFMHEVW